MKETLTLDEDTLAPDHITPELKTINKEDEELGAEKTTQRKEIHLGIRDQDIFTIYFREMGRTPLLNREKEVVIGKRRERSILGIIAALISIPLLLERLKKVVPPSPSEEESKYFPPMLTEKSLATEEI
jgi:hypothetical protein